MPVTEIQAVKEAAEAICGALHRLSFDVLGESEDGASTWFYRGRSPKDVRIEVVRSALAASVLVNIEWRNLSTGTARRGRQTLQIDVRGAGSDVFQATERAVLRCLEIYRDVLQGTGVAGPGAEATPIASTAESNVPETEQEARDAGLTDDD